MITRIVRMHFREEEVSAFIALFEASKPTIITFEGCYSVVLHRDITDSSVYYTLSIWESEDHLNRYRDSDFFRMTWGKTKVLFAEKPMAFSLDGINYK